MIDTCQRYPPGAAPVSAQCSPTSRVTVLHCTCNMGNTLTDNYDACIWYWLSCFRPDGYTYTEFRPLFVLFSLYISKSPHQVTGIGNDMHDTSRSRTMIVNDLVFVEYLLLIVTCLTSRNPAFASLITIEAVLIVCWIKHTVIYKKSLLCHNLTFVLCASVVKKLRLWDAWSTRLVSGWRSGCCYACYKICDKLNIVIVEPSVCFPLADI